MSRRLNRRERRSQDDQTWFTYKKPTRTGEFFKVFQYQSWNAGVPILNKKDIDVRVSSFINDFKWIERFDLDYLNSILPIRFCNILPRNHAAMLLALYINAVAEKESRSFIDTFKNMSNLNSLFEKKEKKERQWDEYLSSEEFRRKIYDIEEKKSKQEAYYIIKARLESPLLIEPIDIMLLFELELFINRNKRIYAILNFSRMRDIQFSEGIAFFEDKVQDDQNIEVFYENNGRITFTRVYWEPHVEVARKNAHQVLKKYREKYMSNTIIDYYRARKLVGYTNPKVLNKNKYKTFEGIYKSRGMKLDLKDIMRDFKIFLPKDQIEIKNYHALLGIVKAPKLYPWTPPPPLDATIYRIIKRRLFLHKMVGPFREVCGLPKRKKINGKVEIYTKEIPPGMTMRTKDILNEHASPSQILYKIAKFAQNNAGDVEKTLQYIRGLYRASKKIAFYIDNNQPDLVEKIASRYLEV